MFKRIAPPRGQRHTRGIVKTLSVNNRWSVNNRECVSCVESVNSRDLLYPVPGYLNRTNQLYSYAGTFPLAGYFGDSTKTPWQAWSRWTRWPRPAECYDRPKNVMWSNCSQHLPPSETFPTVSCRHSVTRTHSQLSARYSINDVTSRVFCQVTLTRQLEFSPVTCASYWQTNLLQYFFLIDNKTNPFYYLDSTADLVNSLATCELL